MRPTLVTASKAMRLPLHSKRANKDYYKGTRTGNIMVRKRIAVANRYTGEPLLDKLGRVRSWNEKTHRIDESRVGSYVVPPGLADCKVRTKGMLVDGVMSVYHEENPQKEMAGLTNAVFFDMFPSTSSSRSSSSARQKREVPTMCDQRRATLASKPLVHGGVLMGACTSVSSTRYEHGGSRPMAFPYPRLQD